MATEICAGVELRALPGEGRTLFAQRAFSAGECILRERPACVARSREELVQSVVRALKNDPGALLPSIGQVPPCATAEDINEFASKMISSFSFEFLDGANVALFRVIGTINHACATSKEANCCLSLAYDAGEVSESETVALVAVQPVQAGEPLRMSYLCPFAPPDQLEMLERSHQFKCRCSTCRTGPPPPALRCCLSCGTCRAAVGGSLMRCSGCRAVFYCSVECQKRHRPEHRHNCKQPVLNGHEDRGQDAFLNIVRDEFDSMMESSHTAMVLATEALKARTGRCDSFVAEQRLEESLAAAGRFIAHHGSTARISGSNWRLAQGHSFLYYARGNAVKQALTRLAMRLRLRGAEPAGGCNALAKAAQSYLDACLSHAIAELPQFHVELASLLRDVTDLGELATNLRGLAVELAQFGTPEEGCIEQEGLGDVERWVSDTLAKHQGAVNLFGEGPGSLCTDEISSPEAWSCADTGLHAEDATQDTQSEEAPHLNEVNLGEFRNDLQHFNSKFGSDVSMSLHGLCGLGELSREALEELKAILSFYAWNGQSKHQQTEKMPPPEMSTSDDSWNQLAPGETCFQPGDRVLCNMGICWECGQVLATGVPDPYDPEGALMPYSVQLDSGAGYKDAIFIPVDDEGTICREVCFDAKTQLHLTKAATPLSVTSGGMITNRFEMGTRVGCRIRDAANGTAVWEAGTIRALWPALPPPHQLPYGKRTAEHVPYLVQLDSEAIVYVHRDDHTLIRLEENIPQQAERGIAKRFEVLHGADGKRLRFDHQTMRSRTMEDSDSD